MTTNAQTPAKLYYEDVQVGDTIPELVKPALSHIQLVRYAGASGDFNPLHTDPKFGELIGTGGIIAHGMLIMGFVGQMLSDYFGPTMLRKLEVRFKGLTRIDDVITCTGTITEKHDADNAGRITGKVRATDQNGAVKITGPFVVALLRRSHYEAHKLATSMQGRS